MSVDEHVGEYLKTLLQRDVQFTVNDKILREGKLIVFNIKDFYITFTIHTKKNQTKTYDVPLPYKIYKNSESVTLNYKLPNIHHNRSNILRLIESISKSVGKKSKLYDNYLIIKFEA